MTRWCFPCPNKRTIFFCLICASGVLLAFHAPRSFTKTPAPSPESPLNILKSVAPPDTGYTLQDGTIVDSSTVSLRDTSVDGPSSVDTLDLSEAYARAEQMAKQAAGRVFKENLTPHWFDDGKRFWYRNDTKDGTKDFVLVVPDAGTKLPAFDHEKLAASLSKAANATYQGNKLPFDNIEFADGAKSVLFAIGDKFWKVDLGSYDCVASQIGPKTQDKGKKDADLPTVDEPRDPFHNSYDSLLDDELSPEERIEQKAKGKQADPKKGGGKGPPGATKDAKSPDGNWSAFIKERNVWVRDKDGKETQVTKDGVEGDSYSAVSWSPDSKVVVTYRSTPGDNKTVYRIETSPADQLYARLHEKGYPRAMDKMATHEMWLIRVDELKPIKVDIERIDFRGIPRLRWSMDNQTFTFEKTDRGHQRFRVIEVDAKTGKTRYYRRREIRFDGQSLWRRRQE